MTKEMEALVEFKPTPCREWTWWDHLVFSVTGRVSQRVYADRMEKLWQDHHRLSVLKVELDLARRTEEAGR